MKDIPRNKRTTGAVQLIDAAVAFACAPAYFDRWQIAGIQMAADMDRKQILG